MELDIANVINISVAEAQTGIGAYNTSNLAIFTEETAADSFGDDGFKIYLSPSDVATDFGTDSKTYKQALAVFSQQPNILAGGGYLVVIKKDPMETYAAAITRTEGLVQYFGLINQVILSDAPLLAAAAVVQTLNKIMFIVQHDEAELEPGETLDQLRTGGYTQTRGLYYGEGDDETDSLLFMAAYAGRALSTNFEGSNTTSTMHLKDIKTIQPDLTLTQTLLTKALAAGADTYPSLQGVPKVYCSGTNHFFDQVYNLRWIVGALQVAGFNYLATTSTKIPQTEGGMNGLKGAYRKICEQGVTNQYLAPGSWQSPDTFGNLQDFYDNISQRGYYIFSIPITQQSQTAREARQAPLIQIAVKEAGAIHSSSVIIFVNA